jgi:hypothetical protein
MSASTPTAIPTPSPAFAPVDRPAEDCGEVFVDSVPVSPDAEPCVPVAMEPDVDEDERLCELLEEVGGLLDDEDDWRDGVLVDARVDEVEDA